MFDRSIGKISKKINRFLGKIQICLLFWLFVMTRNKRGKFTFFVRTKKAFDRCDGLFCNFAQFDICPDAALVPMHGIQIALFLFTIRIE